METVFAELLADAPPAPPAPALQLPEPADSAPPLYEAGRTPWETCEECGVATRATVALTEHICPDCGRVYTRPCEEEQAQFAPRLTDAKVAPRLRMVGADAFAQQRLLDKSSSTDGKAACVQDIIQELTSYNREFSQTTGKVYPPAVLAEVAHRYVEDVRTEGQVIRAQNKQAVLALLVFIHSQKYGRTRQDAAQLLQLNTNGLAKGENKLRRLGACEQLLNQDPHSDQIDAVFVSLGIVYNPRPVPGQTELEEAAARERGEDLVRVDAAGARTMAELKTAALELLAVGQESNVGTLGLAPRTRAIGAAYCVLRRAARAGRLPVLWRMPSAAIVPSGERGSLEWLAQKCNIRRQTLDGFLRIVAEYHSRFQPVFERHGFYAGRCDAL